MKMYTYSNESGTREGVVFDNDSRSEETPQDYETGDLKWTGETLEVPETFSVQCFSMYENHA